MTVLLVGWALRLYDLGRQSLWYDEGTSAALATRSVGTILANAAADIHPPLYYLLLHVWVPFAGTGEYSLRLPSAMFGLLTAAVVYRLGADLFGSSVGFVAAALLAGAPLPVWYSQEARMYALATGLGALATLLFVRSVRRRRLVDWIAYALALAVTLHSHYVAAAVPLAHGVALAIWWLGAPGTRWPLPRAWGCAAAGAALLFAPWLSTALGQLTGWPATSRPFGASDLVTRTLALFAQGQGGEGNLLSTSALPYATALVLGVVALTWRARHVGELRGPGIAGLILLAYLAVPLGAILAMSWQRPFFHPKFIVLIAPAAELIAALGVVAVATVATRRLHAGMPARSLMILALGAGLVAWRADGLIAQWSDPRLQRDDYRGVVATISREAGPDDAVILNAPGQIEIFDYYYGGDLPRHPLPTGRPMDEAATRAVLATIAEKHERVWLILWATPESDPTGVIERWLDERMYKASNQWFGGVRLASYLNPTQADLAVQRFEPGARFGNVADLIAVEFPPAVVRPGGVVPVRLEWRAGVPTDAPYKVFVHLTDREDYLWGQRDSEPVGGARPTTGWQTGEMVVDRHGLPVLPGTPPGDYAIALGLYRADTGERLPIRASDGVSGGDRLILGPVVVRPATAGMLPSPRNPLQVAVGSGRLLGFDLHPLGRDEAAPEVASGEPVLLTLYWQAGDRFERPPRSLAVRLVGEAADEPREHRFELTLGRRPAESWTPGELIRDPYRIQTTDLSPGRYAVSAALRDEHGTTLYAAPAESDGWIALGRLEVR